MSQYPFADTRRNRILLGVFLTAMLYLARDTLLTTSILGFARSQILMLGLMGAAAIVFLVHNRRNLKEILTDRRVGLLLIFTAVLLLPMIGKQDWQMMYFSVLLCLYFSVFLTYFTNTEEVARMYVLAMAVIGAYSVLATYGLRLLPDGGVLPVPVFRNPTDLEFYNFGISYVSVSYVSTRNFGIFREPGVYQYFVMLALILNNYTASWKKDWQLWLINGILAVTMLSTLAAGGYVEMALFAVILFFDKKLYRSKLVWGMIVLMIGAIAGVYLYSKSVQNQLYWEIYGMLYLKFAEGETSGFDRIFSLLVNLKFFLKNPLFGGKVAEVLYSMENNTSSTTLMFAIFGLLGGLAHVVGWFALLWKKQQKIWVSLGLLLVAFMSFNTQNLIADVFLWLLPTMALTERVLKLKETRE